MKKYFNTTDARDTDNADVFLFMNRADKHWDDFIRIALNEEHMLLNCMGRQEYEISRAMVFLWDNEAVMRFDFEPEDPDAYFYCAADPKNGIAIRLSTPETDLEGFNTFGTNTGLFGLFMTEEETIFLTYDGTADRIGCSILPETKGVPRVMEEMEMLFNLFRTYMEEIEKDNEAQNDAHPNKTEADEE